jgi:hypothetical protein
MNIRLLVIASSLFLCIGFANLVNAAEDPCQPGGQIQNNQVSFVIPGGICCTTDEELGIENRLSVWIWLVCSDTESDCELDTINGVPADSPRAVSLIM